MASSHIITIPFQEQERRLLSQLNRMREQDQLCDMTVRVGTREFRCHQAVLAASSGHFLSVFVQGVLSFPKILDLTFTSADVFSIILDFIYTASLKCPPDVLPQVLQAAKGYIKQGGVRPAQPISANLPVPAGVNTLPAGVNTLPAGVKTVPSSVRSAQSTCTNLPVPVPSGVNTPMSSVNTLMSGVNTPMSGVNTPVSGVNTPMSGVNTPVSDVNTPLSTPSPGELDSVVVKQEEQEFSHEDTRPQSEDSTGSQNADLRSEVTSLRQQISDVIGEEIPPAHSFLALGPDQVAGERELYPGSGVYIHQSDLQILVHRANYSGRQLCHNLFDHLHRDVDLTHYSAFHTKHGFGKAVLDQNVLEAIEELESGHLEEADPEDFREQVYRCSEGDKEEICRVPILQLMLSPWKQVYRCGTGNKEEICRVPILQLMLSPWEQVYRCGEGDKEEICRVPILQVMLSPWEQVYRCGTGNKEEIRRVPILQLMLITMGTSVPLWYGE
uniref:BTB domain-containing protein n=1 Tax=Branchiostoma floridae TaxID=7739 RepID=C3ZDH6_BRAFL|eukprot:XP_002592771.1 hypothetical protein BRAFLDRAFT_117718 [Branchiostoma floridae]